MEDSFNFRVNHIVSQIPEGRVMSYGQIAALAGSPQAARIVGGIAHFGNPELPWQRVVSKSGGLASGYPGGKKGHMKHLQQEGVEVDEVSFSVNIDELLWWPNE